MARRLAGIACWLNQWEVAVHGHQELAQGSAYRTHSYVLANDIYSLVEI